MKDQIITSKISYFTITYFELLNKRFYYKRVSGGLDSNQNYVHPMELLIDVVSIRRYILITTRVTITPPPEKRYLYF